MKYDTPYVLYKTQFAPKDAATVLNEEFIMEYNDLSLFCIRHNLPKSLITDIIEGKEIIDEDSDRLICNRLRLPLKTFIKIDNYYNLWNLNNGKSRSNRKFGQNSQGLFS